MKTRIIFSVMVIVFVLMFAGCGAGNVNNAGNNGEVQNNEPLQHIFEVNNYPACDGTALTLGMEEAFYCALTGASDEDARLNIVHTGNAINNLLNGNANLIIVETNPDTLFKAAKEAGVEIEVFPVAEDYFVFYDDSQRAKPVKAAEKKNGSEYNITSETAEGIIYETITDSGLKYRTGYELSGYLPDYVKIYSIDGVEPGRESVESGAYKFTYFCYAVIRADIPESSAERKIIKAMLSEEGQALMEEAGYVKIQE